VKGEAHNASGPVEAERLEWLLKRHAAVLELYARQFCRCADDVVQEAIIELAALPAAPRDDVGWLYGTVRHKAITAARREQRRKRREIRVAEARPEWFSGLAEQNVDARIAVSVLHTLPEEQREVIVAHVWGGLSFQQIAAFTGTSDSTAHRRYHAGLAAIRKKLRVPCPKNE